MWTAGDSSTSRPAATTEWPLRTGGDNALEALLVALDGDPLALDIPLAVIAGGFVVRGRLVTDDEFAGHVDRVLEELIRGADYFVTGAEVDQGQIDDLREELLALFKRGPFQQGRLRRRLARRRLADRAACGNGSGSNGANRLIGEQPDGATSRNGAKGLPGTITDSGGIGDGPARSVHLDLDALADPGGEPPSTDVLTLKAAEVLVPGQGWTRIGLIRVLVSQVSAWWLSGYSDSPLDL